MKRRSTLLALATVVSLVAVAGPGAIAGSPGAGSLGAADSTDAADSTGVGGPGSPAGIAGIAAGQEATPEGAPEGTPTNASTNPPTDEPLEPHVNPDEVDEPGDVDRLSAWLGAHVTGRLEGSAIQLSQGQYERADELLSEDLQDRLSQYVDVVGDTDEESDDRAAETAEETADDQRRLTEDVTEYRETHEAYREARQSGDEAAARRLGHELEDLAGSVRESSVAVRGGYGTLEDETGLDMSEGRAAIDAVEANVTSTQAAVREETFVSTTLSVSANRSTAAFDAPAGLSGRLVAANGSAVANRSVRLTIAGREHDVRTDAAGRFAVTYRPVLAPIDDETVRVRYEPNSTSPYLGSTANVTLGIEQVEPDVAVDASPERVAYGDDYVVRASVRVDGRPVSGVPVAASIDGREVGSGATNTDGESAVRGIVGRELAAGEREVRAAVDLDGRAIGGASGGTTLTVEERSTAVEVDATVDGGRLVVDGRLLTEDDVGVDGASVTLEIAGVARTVETGTDGSFEGAFELGAGDLAGVEGNHTALATYDGGPNLAGATGRTTIEIPAAVGGGDPVGGVADRLVENPSLLGVVAAIVVLVAGGAWLAWRRVRRTGETAARGGSGSAEDQPDGEGGGADADRWLERARTALAAGDEPGAIARAHAASYAEVARALGHDGEWTSRELLAAAEGRIDDSRLAALATVTAAYERMAFGGDGADSGPGAGPAEILEAATTVVDGGGGSTAG